MGRVTSKDGTTIAFDAVGEGPALILVGGALEQRALDSETARLAPLLARHFTVYHYDRRGRGDSTDTRPYAVEREIEDIDALIDEAGGTAYLFWHLLRRGARHGGGDQARRQDQGACHVRSAVQL